MFKANQDTTFVPTKTISIKPEAQVNYNPKNQNQVRWLIPQYIGFFDPRGTTLKYKLQMSGRGHPKPDFKGGVHSLWRDVRVRDGTASTEMEMLSDYNVFVSQWWDYTNNESINHKRDLFEGRSANSDYDNQLFYGSMGNWTNGDITTTYDRKTLEINQPIHSGILGGSKVFPVVATQGLRCEMTLDQFQRSCITTSNLGEDVGDWLTSKVAILGATGADDNAKQAKTAIDSEFSVVIRRGADNNDPQGGGRGINRSAEPVNNNPFDIGDPIYIRKADNSDETLLGIITKFGKDGDDDCVISYIPARANGDALGTDFPVGSRVYYKVADRLNGYVPTNVPANQIAQASVGQSYQISDLEMLLLQVQPPAQYVEGMMKQISSEKGLSLDYRTHSLYRFNLNTLNGLTNQLIPATQQRAYSIFSVPLNQGEQLDIRASAFQGAIDGCQNYQYVFGGSLIPDRPINLQRYTQDPARTDALHLVELEKALINANYGVRNLLRVPSKFLIGRAFSKYGQIFNLQNESLSLRIEYQGATEQKLFEHFVCYLRRVNISPNGVMAMS
jgi:hypothetical protein